MKQAQIGISVIAGIAILAAGVGAYFVLGAPSGFVQSRPVSAPTQTPLAMGKGFDFYVLALSWSPTYCQDDQARKRDVIQCSGPRPFAFVVHGLWPQFESGYPRSCPTSHSRPSQTQARAMLDIMPSERLVQHEWESHGTCSGLEAREYLSVVRAAADRVAIPETYASAPDWRRVSAGDVEAAFVAANPSMTPTGIGVAKRGNNLSEVRICLTLDLAPRNCPQVDQSGVKASTRLALPPSRG
jgi:ribonuclease T2